MKITLGWGLTWIYYNGKLTANTRGKTCLAWNVEGPVMYLIFLSISSRKKKKIKVKKISLSLKEIEDGENEMSEVKDSGRQ